LVENESKIKLERPLTISTDGLEFETNLSKIYQQNVQIFVINLSRNCKQFFNNCSTIGQKLVKNVLK
jgi:hypothetical protein